LEKYINELQKKRDCCKICHEKELIGCDTCVNHVSTDDLVILCEHNTSEVQGKLIEIESFLQEQLKDMESIPRFETSPKNLFKSLLLVFGMLFFAVLVITFVYYFSA